MDLVNQIKVCVPINTNVCLMMVHPCFAAMMEAAGNRVTNAPLRKRALLAMSVVKTAPVHLKAHNVERLWNAPWIWCVVPPVTAKKIFSFAPV